MFEQMWQSNNDAADMVWFVSSDADHVLSNIYAWNRCVYIHYISGYKEISGCSRCVFNLDYIWLNLSICVQQTIYRCDSSVTSKALALWFITDVLWI